MFQHCDGFEDRQFSGLFAGPSPGEICLVRLGDMKQYISNSQFFPGLQFRKCFNLRAVRGANPAVKGAPLRSAGLRLLRSLRPLPLR